jgi:hypothetical protein
MRSRFLYAGGLLLTAALFGYLGFTIQPEHVSVSRAITAGGAVAGFAPSATNAMPADAPTTLYAHNLLLQQGPSLQIYFVWMRGQLVRTHPDRIPSFDDPKSFRINVQKGVFRVQLLDIARVLNSPAVQKGPLSNVRLSIKNGLLQMQGTLHKVVPLPVQLTGSISGTPDSKLILHVQHLDVLHLPLKGLLGGLHIKLDDLVQSKTPGIAIHGNDVILDAQQLLPPPHIGGQLTSLHLVDSPQGPAIEAIFGNAGNTPEIEQRWHNFLQLTDGTLDFGKLTMHHVDLIMIDASKEPWFLLNLDNYQAQLVAGVTHMTPQAGLQIFMPKLADQPRMRREQATITMQWLKDRNQPPPPGIPQ